MEELRASLEAALSALREADDRRALFALIRAWQAWKDPGIADLADRASARLTAELPEVTEQRFDKIVEQLIADPALLERAMEKFPSLQHFPAKNLLNRISQCMEGDPRLTTALIRLFEDPPYATKGSAHVYLPGLFALACSEDVRARRFYETALRPTLERFFIGGAFEQIDKYYKRGQLRMSPIKSPGPLPSEVAALVAQLEELLPDVVDAPSATQVAAERLEADFLRGIVADRDSDEPRLVFHDWLLEQDDPRAWGAQEIRKSGIMAMDIPTPDPPSRPPPRRGSLDRRRSRLSPPGALGPSARRR